MHTQGQEDMGWVCTDVQEGGVSARLQMCGLCVYMTPGEVHARAQDMCAQGPWDVCMHTCVCSRTMGCMHAHTCVLVGYASVCSHVLGHTCVGTWAGAWRDGSHESGGRTLSE